MIILKKQHLEAALLVAPKNDSRFYLNSVLIEVTAEGAVYVVSTNGSMMFVGEINEPDFTGSPIKSLRVVMPRSIVEQALKVMPRLIVEQALKVKDKISNIELKRSGDAWQLGSVLFPSTDGEMYPNWRRVNVSPGDINTSNPEPAQYNPESLALAHKALKKWSDFNKKGTAMLHQRGNSAGVLVHLVDNSAHVVIMPWRTDTNALPRVVKPF